MSEPAPRISSETDAVPVMRQRMRTVQAERTRLLGTSEDRSSQPGLHAVPRPAPRRRRVRWLAVTAVCILGLVAIAVVISFFIDEPLRRRIERELNAALEGYTVRIGALSFHPIGFSLDLRDTTIVQRANPQPPVARIPRLHASVHWRALLHGRLVADFLFDRPVVHVDLTQARQEAKDDVKLKDRGWQQAAETVYPLKINLFRVADGDVTYTDRGPFEPLHVTHVNFQAENIRNVRSREREYPSDIHLDAVVFGTGSLRFDGHADFLAEPYTGIETLFRAERIPLRPFTALLSRYASIRGGVLSARGELEYSPRIGRVDLKTLTVDGVRADYIRTPDNAAEEARGTEQAVQAAQAVSNAPAVQLRADEIRIRRSVLGFENRTVDPPFRLFLADAELTLRHFSNQRAEGPSLAWLQGRFMGSGETILRARFQPETKAPNFDLDLRVEDTDLQSLNDLLRAQGNFDVARGRLSLYSTLRVRDLTVDGYVKPVFKDVQVFDAQQDRDKPLRHRFYERLVGVAMRVLRSWQRHQIATKADLSGPVTSPRTSTWQIVGGLLENALIKPIEPGLEESTLGTEPSASPRGRPTIRERR
jgi:Domain of Unknown Function (DUF748)